MVTATYERSLDEQLEDLFKRGVTPEYVGEGTEGKIYRLENNGTDIIGKSIRMGGIKRWSDVERLKREASIASELDHPALAKYRGFEVEEVKTRHGSDTEFILYRDYVKGETLKERIARKKLTENEASDYLSQLQDVVEYLHSENVLHRDIKPSNIVITPEGKLKLIDLDLAKKEGQLTLTGSFADLVGTLNYMAPEVLKKGEKPTKQSDWFSVGATILEGIVGEYKGFLSSSEWRGILSRWSMSSELKGQLTNYLQDNPKKRVRWVKPVPKKVEYGKKYSAMPLPKLASQRLQSSIPGAAMIPVALAFLVGGPLLGAVCGSLPGATGWRRHYPHKEMKEVTEPIVNSREKGVSIDGDGYTIVHNHDAGKDSCIIRENRVNKQPYKLVLDKGCDASVEEVDYCGWRQKNKSRITRPNMTPFCDHVEFELIDGKMQKRTRDGSVDNSDNVALEHEELNQFVNEIYVKESVMVQISNWKLRQLLSGRGDVK